MPSHTVHLVDASVYVFRAYFSVAPEFTDRDERPVHAVYGFLGFLLTLLEQARPSHLAIAFDQSLTTSFRNKIYPAYKANRELPPADLDVQFEYCRELVDVLGLTGLVDADYEADDLIGTALHRLRPAGFRAVIVSADKDLTQLVGVDDQIWDFAKNLRYGREGVLERLGVAPEQVADFLALTGDGVDNIPGVPGIGPKTAAQLLGHFGSLDAVLERVEEVPYLRAIRGAAGVAAKLKTHRDQAILCRRLTGIATEAPWRHEADQLRPRRVDPAHTDALMDKLRFGPLTRRRVREYAERTVW